MSARKPYNYKGRAAICKYCGGSYIATKRTQRFDSDRCRKRAFWPIYYARRKARLAANKQQVIPWTQNSLS